MPPRTIKFAGGFIFDWCDEYWKGNNPNSHVGGPNQNFLGDAFAGGYGDEAWYGVTSSVAQSDYGFREARYPANAL